MKNIDEFMKANKISVKITFIGKMVHPLWNDDVMRNAYKVVAKCNGKQYTFRFYDSINNTMKGIEPTAYDVLSCLITYEIGDFEDFCQEFGYNLYNEETGKYDEKSKKIWKACEREYKNVMRLFGDFIEEFSEVFA